MPGLSDKSASVNPDNAFAALIDSATLDFLAPSVSIFAQRTMCAEIPLPYALSNEAEDLRMG